MDSATGSCVIQQPGRYVFSARGNSSTSIQAFVDIVPVLPILTLIPTRVEVGRPARVMLKDVAAILQLNVSVTIKVLGSSVTLLLQRSGEFFIGTLRQEIAAEFLDLGLPSTLCSVEYVSAAGLRVESNLILGRPLIPEILSLGEVVSFTLNSPRICSVHSSRFQVIATASSFSKHPLTVSVVNIYSTASCQLKCRFKTSMHTRARPGHQESLQILTALPGDDLFINVMFPSDETIIFLNSQAKFAPTFSIIAPSVVFAGAALEVTLVGFQSLTASIVARNVAFQAAVLSSNSNGSSNNNGSSSSIFQTSVVAFSPAELFVRPGDFISILVFIKNSGTVLETRCAVAETASINVHPEAPVFGSIVEIFVHDADSSVASEAIASIVRNGTILRSSDHRIHLTKSSPRILSGQLDLSHLILARLTDTLLISYQDHAPYSVISTAISFRETSTLPNTQANFSAINFSSSLSLSPSGQLVLHMQSQRSSIGVASALSCTISSVKSALWAHPDEEILLLHGRSDGALSGSIELVSMELSALTQKCSNSEDGCLLVHPRHNVSITCGNAIVTQVVLDFLPVHGFFSDSASNFFIYSGYADTSVDVVAVDAATNYTDYSCQSACSRAPGSSVTSCLLCDSPLFRKFRALVSPSSSLNLPLLAFESEPHSPPLAFALADSSVLCVTESAAFAHFAFSPSSSSCGDCFAHIAAWNGSSAKFELMMPHSSLHSYINASSCLHVWLVLPARVVFSSTVCFFPPEFTPSTPPNDSVFPIGLNCSFEITASVSPSAVCYRLQQETASLKIIAINSVAARISWLYSPALPLPSRVCVQALVAPFGCDGPMGSGVEKLFSTRCWSLVPEPCVACAGIGDNLVTIARRYSVDPVSVASIYFSTQVNMFASEDQPIDTNLPFGTPVRLGLVYEGSAGESLQVSERFSPGNTAALLALNPNVNLNASIEGKLVCIPVDVNPVKRL
jgi:hypothetical protein